ncbi:MAG: alpha/beta hydrolase-fold protein [Actinomycetota bacterium]|nr:alpha/beta hydrolase-fold protein [Actinomycetota bacterium]
MVASPLFEPIPGDRGHLRATVFWRGDAERVAVLGGLGGWSVEGNLMERDGELWRRSYRIPRALRTTYLLLPDPPDQLDWTPELFRRLECDPLNPRTWRTPADEEDREWGFETARSLLEAPDAPAQPWIEARPGVARGTTEVHRVSSEILGNERRVWVHLPAGYDSSERYGLLLVFDGWAYVELVPTPTIVDNLVAAGRIPPVVAVMPDSLSQDVRSLELPCHAPFVEFLAQELLPWARERWSIDADPGRSVVAGSSFGGLAAVYAAFERPDLFDAAISQSGSFGWGAEDGRGHEWLTNRIEAADRRPVRFWLEIGSLEHDERQTGGPSGLRSNRRLRDVLGEKGYDVTYSEYDGGHDYVCWRGSLAEGLVALLGR